MNGRSKRHDPEPKKTEESVISTDNEDVISRQRRRTAVVAACKIKRFNKSNTEDEELCSNEEMTSSEKLEDHLYQNGRRYSPKKSQQNESINTKSTRQKRACTSKAAYVEATSSLSSDDQSACEIKKEEKSGSEEETHSRKTSRKKNKIRKCKSFNESRSSSDSEHSQMANWKCKRKQAGFSDNWQNGDVTESSEKSSPKRPTPQKKNSITDSEEEGHSTQSTNDTQVTKRCTKWRSGDSTSKRKHITSASDSDHSKENPSIKKKLLNRNRMSRPECESGSDGSHEPVERASQKGKPRTKKQKRYISSSESEAGEGKWGSSDDLVSYSCATQKRHTRRHESSTSEMERDRFKKRRQVTQIRTRNLGRKMVNYRDCE